MKRPTLILLAGLTAMLAACSAVENGMEGHQSAVARANGFDLSIEHAADLMAIGGPDVVPARESAVDRLADLWIGYTILASELASPDTFSDIDLTPMVRLAMEQDMVWKLREGIILSRAEPTESELTAYFEREQPYTSVDAQHILIAVADTADEAAADSAARLAEDLRQRLLAGADFDALAREYSDDAGTSAEGGRLGWVTRGRVVPELEAALFAAEPGEITETVRSRLGYHIARVNERQAPELEAVRDNLRDMIMQERLQSLENAYIDSLREAANVRIVHGAPFFVRQMAASPGLERLSPARRSGALVRYRGGEVTTGEWADLVLRSSQSMRRAFASADSATAVELLNELTRNELLVKAARDNGYTVSPEVRDSLFDSTTRELLATASVSRFRRDELLQGDSAIRANVDRVIRELITRQRSPQPIDRLSLVLRHDQVIQIHPGRYPAVVDRLLAIRGGERPASETATEGSE